MSDRKNLAICQYYQWFIPAVDKWMDLAKLKAHQRVRRAAELDRICTGEMIVKHCTSAVDATACFYQVKQEIFVQKAQKALKLKKKSYGLYY